MTLTLRSLPVTLTLTLHGGGHLGFKMAALPVLVTLTLYGATILEVKVKFKVKGISQNFNGNSQNAKGDSMSRSAYCHSNSG